MCRDELILSCREIVDNLIKKYNNHVIDEDLRSVGIIAAIECVDWCKTKNITEIDQIQRMCNKWIRDRLLKEIYSPKFKTCDDELPIEEYGYEECPGFEIYAKQVLTPHEYEFYTLCKKGFSREEIMSKLNIVNSTFLGLKLKCFKKLQTFFDKN